MSTCDNGTANGNALKQLDATPAHLRSQQCFSQIGRILVKNKTNK